MTADLETQKLLLSADMASLKIRTSQELLEVRKELVEKSKDLTAVTELAGEIMDKLEKTTQETLELKSGFAKLEIRFELVRDMRNKKHRVVLAEKIDAEVFPSILKSSLHSRTRSRYLNHREKMTRKLASS